MFVLDGAVWCIACSCKTTLRIPAVRTTKLNHEVVDHAVKMQPIVKAAFRERDEVLRSERHLVEVELDGEIAERRFAKSSRVGHGRAA